MSLSISARAAAVRQGARVGGPRTSARPLLAAGGRRYAAPPALRASTSGDLPSSGVGRRAGRRHSKRVVVSRDVLADPSKGQKRGDSVPGAGSEAPLKLNIQGRHLKVTESLRRHVESQVERATTHFMLHHHDVNKGKNAPISRVDVRLSSRGGPKHQTKGPQLQKAEVTVFTVIGVVRAEVETDNAYNAIDEAGRTVERKLRKLKEKAVAKGVWNGHGVRPKHKRKGNKSDLLEKERGPVEAAAFFADQEEDVLEEEASMRWETESFVEDFQGASLSQAEQDLNIYRKKEVDLIPMTIEDAVESLQFLGHDFFMFLDKEEREIKVVYKRDVAGYGVLSPRLPPTGQFQ